MSTTNSHAVIDGSPTIQSSQTLQTQVFTEPEAARLLRISRVTLQRIRLRGEISFSRIGGTRVIYTEKHLGDYLAARERAAFHTC